MSARKVRIIAPRADSNVVATVPDAEARRKWVVHRASAELLEARIAPAFSAVFNIPTLNGANGFEIAGVTSRDYAGVSVSGAGDVNGDGFDDVVIGAEGVDGAADSSGASYVIFGGPGGFPSVLNLAALDGTNGFRLTGMQTFDRSGHTVSRAGDVNADGFDDVIVGGESGYYIIFGKQSPFAASMDLAALDGVNGFKLSGIDNSNGFYSGKAAGDVNADGYGDLIIGSSYESAPGVSFTGAAFVIFGHAGPFAANFNISGLNGANGFRMNGAGQFDVAGHAVSGAGDVNGDGFDDVIVGAEQADANGGNSGAAYVVFGRASGFAASFSLSTLNGTNGFRLVGAAAFDEAGAAVGDAGDVNGDGFDDVIVGAGGADLNGDYSGASYVIFGKSAGFGANMNVSQLDGINGFVLNGANSQRLGFSVSGAGDINGDGFADVIVGVYSGSDSYVVYGKAGAFASHINAATLNGTDGFTVKQTTFARKLTVSGAGDVNGDGLDDILTGDSAAGQTSAGAAWLVLGQGSVDLQLTITDGAAKTTPGSALSYTFAYNNAGDAPAVGTVIKEILAPGVAFIAEENPGWNQSGNNLTYQVGTLAAGAAGTNTLLLHVLTPAAAGVAQIVSSANIVDNGTSGVDRTPADNTATDIDTLEAAPDFVLTSSDGTSSAIPGAALTYTLTYRNEGNQDATGVFLTETLPATSTFNPDASTPGWTETVAASGIFTLNIGALAAGGAGGSALFAVSLPSSFPAGLNEISSTGSIADDGGNGLDPAPANNTAPDVDIVNAAPDLVVTLANAVASTEAGWKLTQTLSYRNEGDQNAAGVVLTQTLSSGAAFDAALSTGGWAETTPGSAIFKLTIDSLASGAGGTALFAVDVAYPSSGGLIHVTGTADIADDILNGADPAPGNNSATSTIALLAPALNGNHRRATFTDSDGDLVKIAVNRGALSPADFTIFAIDDGTRRSLINLSHDGAEFAGASLVITARRPHGGTGDGLVHLGAVDATGIDLASVTVAGDLAQIDAGDSDIRKPAVGRLNVGSLGAQGALTQPDNVFEPLHSEFAGSLGRLTVKGPVRNAVVDVAGSVGAAVIRGDFDGSGGGTEAGVLRARSDIFNIHIEGNFLGGADRSGIFSGGKLGVITIDGDLRSDQPANPIIIAAVGNLAAKKQADAEAMGELHIGGSILNAGIFAGYDRDLVPVNFDAAIGALRVSGSWTASTAAAGVADTTSDGFGQHDALIPGGTATPGIIARIASITIKGAVMGSSTANDHFGLVAEQIAKLTVASMKYALFPGPDNLLLDMINGDFRAVDFA